MKISPYTIETFATNNKPVQKIVDVSPKDFEKNKNAPQKSLHKSMALVLILANVFGQFPVHGITGNDYRSLYFTWKSPKCFYTFLVWIGATFVTFMQFYKMLTEGMNLFEINALVFNACGVINAVFLTILAKNWPTLMKEWTMVEISMRTYGWPKNLGKRIKITAIVFVLTAGVEHTMVQSSKLIMAFRCKKPGEDALKNFFESVYSQVFSLLEYDLWKGILLMAINMLLAFSWTFVDVLIMLLSTAMALRFKQITKRMQIIAEAKVVSEFTWKNLREDYNRLCKLCKIMNDDISYIVLMSYASNLFFILIQLFNSLREMKNNLERVYFFFSFAFLIIRTCSVSLYGAWINDESKRPIAVLNSVPSSVYNLEIRRFIQQIGFDAVSITGLNFFSVTRGLILSIAGAIVTYELVLIQFNENLLKDYDNTPCAG